MQVLYRKKKYRAGNPVSWKNGEIHFRTGDSIDYLARDRKKELKEYVRSM